MSIRRHITIIVIAIIFITCMPIVRTAVVFFHPEVVSNSYLFFFPSVFSILVGAGLIYSIINVVKKARKNIRERYESDMLEKTYKNIVEDSGVCSIIIDNHSIIKFISKNLERLSGYSPTELIGVELYKTLPSAYREQVSKIVSRIFSGNDYDETIQVQVYTKERVDKWVSCRLYAVKDNAGNISQVQMMVWDIDKEKKMQLELEQTEQDKKAQQLMLQTIIDYCPVIIYMKNMKGEFVLTNSRMKNLAGLTAGTESPVSGRMNNRSEKNKLYEEYDRKVMQEKRMVTFEDEFVHRNGHSTNYYLMKFPIFDQDGELEYICTFSTDISSLKKSERLMLEAKKEAEQAKEAQEIFMANMSHEIRTPMNGILGMSNLLMSTSLNDEQKDFMQAIQESAKNLLAIINDLLDFSKIKSGKFHLESTEFKPRQTIKKAMYPLLFRANEKKIPLKSLVDTSVPEILLGDPLRLQQVIINLVGNAVKFTDDGYVEVKIYPYSREGNKILLNIDVVDTGIGIPADKLDNIFESYTQTDTNISRIYGGTGLGLAIVKQLVELQNGTVSVKSKLGEGSTFTVQIPYLVRETYSDNTGETDETTEKENMLKDIKVLVAEDNIINQKVVQKTLMRQNATVEIVSNGQLAVDRLSVADFDIILMDIQMPEMDGYTATKHIRTVMHKNTPIVAMTADAITGEADKCIEVGMNGYISKPFDANDLYNKILELVG